jgi:hypothetical protein
MLIKSVAKRHSGSMRGMSEMNILWRQCGLVCVLSVAVTLLNAVKPLQMDDTAYYYFAAQMAQHPCDPYGFEIYWYESPEAAFDVLAPPVLPYWWSLAIRLFGEQPLVWKLWLLPFNLLFAAALYRLFGRFTPGIEGWLLAMALFSPSFLPGINLMLDIPALALVLTATVLFLRACDRGSVRPAIAAGLAAGLAMQTKYTGLLAPAIMLMYGLLFRRLGLALWATTVAAVAFVSWEVLVFSWYGRAYFLFHVLSSPSSVEDKLRLTQPLLEQLGGTTPALALLGLYSLRVRPRTLAAFAALFLAGYVAIVFIPDTPTSIDWHFGGAEGVAHLADGIFTIFGSIFVGILAAVVVRLRKTTKLGDVETFLLAWLALEFAGYFALSPFGAVRRTMGLVVVSTLLIGRLALLVHSEWPSSQEATRCTGWRFILPAIAGCGIILGLAFFAVDVLDAFAEKHLAERAGEELCNAGGTIWYVGHWGFQYYADHAGMKPVVPDESALRHGDWLVVPDAYIIQPNIDIDPQAARAVQTLREPATIPVRTVFGYYGGGLPLQRFDGPRLSVTIYQIERDCVPRLKPDS